MSSSPCVAARPGTSWGGGRDGACCLQRTCRCCFTNNGVWVSLIWPPYTDRSSKSWCLENRDEVRKQSLNRLVRLVVRLTSDKMLTVRRLPGTVMVCSSNGSTYTICSKSVAYLYFWGVIIRIMSNWFIMSSHYQCFCHYLVNSLIFWYFFSLLFLPFSVFLHSLSFLQVFPFAKHHIITRA